ncbi:MAG TPA: hypothetical protein PLP21_04470 [Pyrinomonadaceae bacterium]|nr:hypothetical protein [Acidobacteriota bacterium]HQZ95547.1 hypothetical protein [Pyrinomonadaceae bacterium]
MNKRFLALGGVLAVLIGLMSCSRVSEKVSDKNAAPQTTIEEFAIEDFAKKYTELPGRLDKYQGKKVKIHGYSTIKPDTVKPGSVDEVYLEIFRDTTKSINGEMTCKSEFSYFVGLLDQKKFEIGSSYKLTIDATYRDGGLRQCTFTEIVKVPSGMTKAELDSSAK